MRRALEGLTVLDIGQLVQGPQAAATLADMGADVIKIELPVVGDLGLDILFRRRSEIGFLCRL